MKPSDVLGHFSWHPVGFRSFINNDHISVNDKEVVKTGWMFSDRSVYLKRFEYYYYTSRIVTLGYPDILLDINT